MESTSTNVSPCLILTATVQVKDDVSHVVRKDSSARLADYKVAFRRWVHTPQVPSLLLVENSGFDLSEFREIAAEVPGKSVEFLSFVCPAFKGSLGKGYGEMLCLQHCLAESQLLRTASSFLKVTGRYYVANAPSLIQHLSLHPDVDVACNLEQNLSWADSRAFGGSIGFLRAFARMLHEIDDSNNSAFERVLARCVHRTMAEGGHWSPLPEALQVHGVSGTIGYTFTPSASEVFRERIKHNFYLWSLDRPAKGLKDRLLGR